MENKEYKIVQQVCRNICNNPDFTDDLVQEVSLIFLELPAEKKTKIRKYFKYWVIRVVMNNWKSSSSIFWNKYRKVINIDPQTIYTLSEEQPEIGEKFCPSTILDKLIEELYPSDRNVFKDYYHRGLTIVQITEKYNTEKTYTWSVIDRIRNSLKRRVEWLDKEPVFKEMILPLIKHGRIKINDRQLILDIYNHKNSSHINEVHDEKKVKLILHELILELFFNNY